ncbi:MAG TPA: PilZ domain-containing protein [Polyangiaceae bacterium]|nr:PilZ domain-containing protein [Polyangiaceae bacterium]
MREDREFQRRPGRHAVRGTCQIVRESDFRLVADRIENLSSWGMLVGPADPVTTGERVYVSFQLPGTTEWFDAMAVVTRVVHGRRPREITRKLGLEFVELSHFDQYRLRKALRAAPPAPPGSRPGRRNTSFSLAALSL